MQTLSTSEELGGSRAAVNRFAYVFYATDDAYAAGAIIAATALRRTGAGRDIGFVFIYHGVSPAMVTRARHANFILKRGGTAAVHPRQVLPRLSYQAADFSARGVRAGGLHRLGLTSAPESRPSFHLAFIAGIPVKINATTTNRETEYRRRAVSEQFGIEIKRGVKVGYIKRKLKERRQKRWKKRIRQGGRWAEKGSTPVTNENSGSTSSRREREMVEKEIVMKTNILTNSLQCTECRG